MKTANVFGATGLVGSTLLTQLLDDPTYEKVIAWGRRPSGIIHEKLEDRQISFERPDTWQSQVLGDVVFCMLGTTLKTAGSKAAQRRVDYDYQILVAKAARQNEVSTYVLVSSAGANPTSPLFYPRLKGELEQAVIQLRFESLYLLRPGPLDGARQENRPYEKLMLGALKALPSWSLPAKGRPVPVEVVARSCRKAAALRHPGVHILEAAEIFQTGKIDAIAL